MSDSEYGSRTIVSMQFTANVVRYWRVFVLRHVCAGLSVNTFSRNVFFLYSPVFAALSAFLLLHQSHEWTWTIFMHKIGSEYANSLLTTLLLLYTIIYVYISFVACDSTRKTNHILLQCDRARDSIHICSANDVTDFSPC